MYAAQHRHTRSFFNQQAEAVANGRRRILAEAFSSASSSLEEPLAGASQHEHEPAA